MQIINQYIEGIKESINTIPIERIESIIELLQEARMRRKQVFIMGNGGSASTASHFVCDLAKNTRKNGLPGFRVIGLTDNMAILSAYGNDDGYDKVFANQLNNLLQVGDIVIAISGSGNSPNVLRAVELANSRGATTIGFTGKTGGSLKTMAKHVIHIQNDRIDEVEDVHLMLEHMICRALKEMEEPEQKDQAEILIAGETNGNDELVKSLFGLSLPLVKKNGSLEEISHVHTELLEKISQEFASKLDLHNLLSRILCLTVDHVGAVGGSIVVLDEYGEVVDGALAYAGQIQDQSPNRLNETVHHGLAGWVLENRQPALVENTKEDPRWMPRGWEATLDLTRSAICVPLITQDRVFGVLTLTRLQSNRFTMEDLSLLTSITLALSYSFSGKQSAKTQG